MTSDPCRRHTSLCLQAEMDMITKDVKMEDQIRIIVRQSVFPPLLVYTLLAVITLAIDIGDSTGTVIYALTMSGVGHKLAMRR